MKVSGLSLLAESRREARYRKAESVIEVLNMNDRKVNETGKNGQSLAVDAAELAKLLSVSVRHVRRMDSAGKLPEPIHIGRCVRWKLSEIGSWCDAGTPDRKKWNSIKGGKNGN